MSTKSKKSRKGLAIGLAILGVAGLSLASASALYQNGGTPQLQADVKDVAGCQRGAITAVFSTPMMSSGEYKSKSLTLTGFDAACIGTSATAAKFKIAVLSSDNVVLQEMPEHPVIADNATIPLGAATPNTISKVAVTIYR